MKVSKAVSAALLAATALAGSAGAFAAIDPATAPSDLFIAVWNPDTSTSVVQDLGVTYSQLGSGTIPGSLNIDNGNLATDLGATTAGYQFQLFAGDLTANPFGFSGDSAFLSLKGGASIPTTIQNGELVNNGLAAIDAYVTKNLPNSTTIFKGTGTSYWAVTPSGPGNTDSFTMNSLAGLGGGAVGSPLNLISYIAGGTPGGADDIANTPVVTSAVGSSGNRGVFNLSGSTLSYSVGASTVPLPAAGWLLISGLLGLVAISRRRDAEAL